LNHNSVSSDEDQTKKKSVLVTGAHGFIGFHLTKRLLLENCNLVLVDNVPKTEVNPELRELLKSPNVEYLYRDLTKLEACLDLPDVQIVFHLAAMNGTKNFYTKPFDVVKHSSIPTLNLLERYKFVEKFFYAGSSESYAGGVNLGIVDVPTDENVPLIIEDVENSRWSYACAKTFGEVTCMSAAQQYGTRIVIGRFHNVYGPRMGVNHVIPDFVLRSLDGKYLLRGATNTRTFIYVTDAVEDVVKLVLENDSLGVFNIGGTHEISMLELAKIILKQMGQMNQEIHLSPAPKGSVGRRVPDITKLDMALGSRPRMDIEEGLRKTIYWYQTDKEKNL
jgi:nucleoside-diphosphate-sugar epimerase